MNDACRLIAGGFKRSFKQPWRGGRRTVWQKQGKDKMNGDRGIALKGLAVTQPITSMHIKNRGI